jgi:Region found in RelA / SpoT proteins./TGS domain./ACT domain.
MGPYGVPIEVQIRTHEMHRMSESGIAAHWLYKSDDDNKIEKFQDRANEWLRDLLEIQKSAGDSLEFIDNLKVDLFPQEVFVFTPQGAIIKLPRGATIIDFAYAVHTDLGNACVSARIDKQLVPLQTKLENGVTVEVITASWARPNPLWLNYVITAKARSGIRNYLKHFKQQEAINLGRRLLEKELLSMHLHLENIDKDKIQALLQVLSKQSLDELLEDIGLGNKMPFLVAKRIAQDDINATVKLDDGDQGQKKPLVIKGTEGMVITLAKCCRPIPGDSIIGYFNPGKGIVVHHHECRNSSVVRKKQTNWLDVEWSSDAAGDFPVELRIEILNQRGSLATIASTISELNSNIENVTVVDQDDRISVDLITLTVKDRVHLAKIMRRLKELSIVLKITRVKA